MTPARQQEEEIFAAAVQLPPQERASYLEKACGADAVLRERIEHLLSALERANPLLKEALPSGSQGFLLSAQSVEKAGDRIGRYKLLEQIGEGGCGVVYVAEQEEPVRRRVALKVIKLGMDTKQVIARFEAERQALAMMDHPNIAKVLDAGATDTGRPYFVMELVRGIKITEFCDKSRVSTRERLDLFIQVCRAIQHAHQKGIIHRDIKPSNILVTSDDGVPVPQVIDFGIAKATQGRLTDQTVYTAFEQFIGTPAYMSPEQAALTMQDIDTRSDIYSLGVLLYELLIGTTPFDAKELLSKGLDEMRRTICEREPPRPSTRLSTLAANALTTAADHRHTDAPKLIHLLRGDLDWIVMKCLEKDRARRYETANGLAADIQRFLKNEAVVARPPTALYRLQKLVRRNQATFAAILVVAVALVLALISLALENTRIARERNQKETALKEKEAALDAARKSEQAARNQLFLSLRSQAQARRYSRQIGQRLESLAAITEAASIRSDEGLRDEAIAAMALPDIRRGPAWTASEATTEAYGFDSLYQHCASIDDQGVISILTISNAQVVQRLNSNPAGAHRSAKLLFSPDGKLLAKREKGDALRVWHWANVRPVLQNPPDNCWALAFSPDSRQLAVGREGWISLFDLVSGRETHRWQARAEANSLAFNPDGGKLAVGYFANLTNVSVFDSKDGALLSDLPVGVVTDQLVAWHPDGRRLAVSGTGASIEIWDVETQRRLATLEGHSSTVAGLSFHPQGALLASSAWDGTTRLWDVASGRQLMQLPIEINCVFSGDGHWLGDAWAGPEQRRAQVLEILTSPEYRTLFSDQQAEASLDGDVSPDGRLLATGMDDGVRLWDLVSNHEAGFIPLGTTVRSAFFELEGNELLTCSGASGLQRWPISANGVGSDQLRLGPPRRIPLPFVPERIARCQGGRFVAVAGEVSGEVLLLDMQTSAPGKVLKHPNAGYVALSQDGRWLAASGWRSDQVQLWDARSGESVFSWEVKGGMAAVVFTPDNRKLIICQQEDFAFYDLATLKLDRRLRREASSYPGSVAFSPDGNLMALDMAPRRVCLAEVSTGRTIANLEDPFGDRATWLGFTPSGTQLVAACRFAHQIHVWDLRSIRAGLKTMGLDWDWPDLPPEQSASSYPGAPLRVQVVGAGN